MAARSLRILRIIARLNIGGPARHVTILDRGLRARGHETLLAYGPVGPGEGSLEDLARDLPTHPVPELGRQIRVAGDLIAFVRILRLLFQVRPDVVHTHTAKAGTLGRLAAAVYNLTRREAPSHAGRAHVSRARARRLFRPRRRSPRAHGRAHAGAPHRPHHRDLGPTASRPHRALPNLSRPRASPSSRWGSSWTTLLSLSPTHPSLRPALGIPDEAVVIGLVGRLVPIKNPSLLVEALAEVVAAAPHAVLLVAGDGPLREDLDKDVRARGLTAHVRFAGWQSDLCALYATCDIVALVSRNEGTPVAVIEAMAAGLPVVATTVGGVPDVIADGRTGLLVPPASPAAIASALVRLVGDDPCVRGSEATRAKTCARDSASERLVGDIERLYLDELGEPLTSGKLRPCTISASWRICSVAE